ERGEDAQRVRPERARALAVTELGKQPGQLGPERRRELTEHLVIVDDAAGAQRIDPWSERQHLLGLVRARREDPKSPSGGQRRKLVQEAALADAGLANEGDDPGLSGAHLVEQRAEFRRLVLSPHQRHGRLGRGGRLRWSHGRLDVGDGAGRLDLVETVYTRSQDLLVQLSGFGLGLGAQLTLEKIDAELVLT